MGHQPLSFQLQEHSITMSHSNGTSTRSLHADDALNVVSDVAPPMHLATTFRYPNDPAALIPVADLDAVSSLRPLVDVYGRNGC